MVLCSFTSLSGTMQFVESDADTGGSTGVVSGPRGGKEQEICHGMPHPERCILCTVCVDPMGRNGPTSEKDHDESGQYGPRGSERLGKDSKNSDALAETVNVSCKRGGQAAKCCNRSN